MRILGIDPGLGITGYGLIETKGCLHKLVEAGIIRSSSREALAVRLGKIYNGIRGIIREFRPDVLVVEELYSHYKHPKTAILMGHVRGVVYLAANESGLPVAGYSATRVKKSIIGYGNASKERIKDMVQNLLELKKLSTYKDVTDALALALTHSYITGREAWFSGKVRR